MLELALEALQDERTIYVQEEPALEIALPQVFEQPTLTALQRGKLANPEALVAKISRQIQATPGVALGSDYQELVTEFQPFFAWATASWDYLLTTEGCRFVSRNGEQKFGARGDYRAVTEKDFSRLVHATFRACVLEFAQQPAAPSVSQWIRAQVWPRVTETYRRLDQPADPRQRTLTPYSYLRCVPYQFLNEYHQALVDAALQHVPDEERQPIATYFLHFYTEAATAEQLGCTVEATLALLRQGLTRLLIHERLVYCLLRQIERY